MRRSATWPAEHKEDANKKRKIDAMKTERVVVRQSDESEWRDGDGAPDPNRGKGVSDHEYLSSRRRLTGTQDVHGDMETETGRRVRNGAPDSTRGTGVPYQAHPLVSRRRTGAQTVQDVQAEGSSGVYDTTVRGTSVGERCSRFHSW